MARSCSVVIVVTIFVAVVYAKECDLSCPSAPKHYEELGCTAVQSSECCPERFQCPDFTARDPDLCYYGGRNYTSGTALDDTDVKHVCSGGCICSTELSGTYIVCPITDCPEYFYPPKENCVLQSDPNECCIVNTICDETEISKLSTCELDGLTFKEGEAMHPEADSCMECVCSEGFDGTLVEPYCQIISCGIEIHSSMHLKNGCVPIYYGNKVCCPIGYRCPESSDVLVTGVIGETSDDPLMKCMFGSLTLNIGDSVSDSNNHRCTKCTCIIPPMVTCVQDPSCYKD